ncbi:MAG: FAD binding domain-containing protein [Deltaproteobacteria bacterium]|nr:FAD binding domain-containing protein [Deltaproteobacteria bacterium]
MRLPEFTYLEPEGLDDVLELLSTHAGEAVIHAGGTDLIVRMKQRLIQPAYVISLKNLTDLNFIQEDNGFTRIGAMTPLVSIAENQRIRVLYPALKDAILKVGAPTIQHFRGTLGGNLCLETRCLFYNQSAFWRSGRSPCHKDHGQICYAEENSDRCRSANLSDGACALMALGAVIEVASPKGKRRLPVEEFFTGKGESPFALWPDELVTEICLSSPGEGEGGGFQKLQYRQAIDYALVSAAAWIAIEGNRVIDLRVVIGGAGASPLLLREAAASLVGKSPQDGDAIEETAMKIRKHASAFMVDNLGATLEYRQKMSGVLAGRAIKQAIERAGGKSDDE